MFLLFCFLAKGGLTLFLINNVGLMALKNHLDASSLRQRVIANNLANLNTPGFKKSIVSFEDQFKSAFNKIPLRTSDERHIGGARCPSEVRPKVVRVTNTSLTPCGNNVNIDEEMVNLVATQLKYNATARFISGYFTTRQHIISGGK